MKLSLLIASRGRPVDLLRTIKEIDDRVSNPSETRISVALDTDDGSNPTPPDTRCELIWSVGEREDSLGAKYNRCASNAPAEAYVLGSDDNIFQAESWDERIRESMLSYNGGFGFVYFGRLDGTLPTNMAIPHCLIERQGFLFPTIWPVWFHDTWIDEIAHMTGRIIWTDILVEEIGGRGKSRGVRDIAFWATLFDATREHRVATAEALSKEFNPTWFHLQLQQRQAMLIQFFAMRNGRLRDPAVAGHFERHMSFDAPEDERYQRIKARAESMIEEAKAKAA